MGVISCLLIDVTSALHVSMYRKDSAQDAAPPAARNEKNNLTAINGEEETIIIASMDNHYY